MRVLIVGSAPDIRLPSTRDFDLVIASNGGVELAIKGGFHVHHLVTTVHLCLTDTPYHRYVRAGWRGVAVHDVFMSEFSGPAESARQVLVDAGLTYDRLNGRSRQAMFEVVQAWSGTAYGHHDLPAKRCSTGMWGVCEAFAMGATSVVLAGFSRVNGHVNSKQHEKGIHHVADDAVLAGLKRLGRDVRTTSPDLAQRAKIAVVR
jgi:hypothetical protein